MQFAHLVDISERPCSFTSIAVCAVLEILWSENTLEGTMSVAAFRILHGVGKQ